MTYLLPVHLAATCAMVGLIWFIQTNHYPLFRLVGADRYIDYQAEHTTRTTWVVAPVMALEALTSLAVLIVTPAGVTRASSLAAFALLAAIWLSTGFVQVPLHRRLLTGFDDSTHRRLVASNWLRTVTWTIRGSIAVSWSVNGVA